MSSPPIANGNIDAHESQNALQTGKVPKPVKIQDTNGSPFQPIKKHETASLEATIEPQIVNSLQVNTQ